LPLPTSPPCSITAGFARVPLPNSTSWRSRISPIRHVAAGSFLQRHFGSRISAHSGPGSVFAGQRRRCLAPLLPPAADRKRRRARGIRSQTTRRQPNQRTFRPGQCLASPPAALPGPAAAANGQLQPPPRTRHSTANDTSPAQSAHIPARAVSFDALTPHCRPVGARGALLARVARHAGRTQPHLRVRARRRLRPRNRCGNRIASVCRQPVFATTSSTPA
jgi:hypothetical protein